MDQNFDGVRPFFERATTTTSRTTYKQQSELHKILDYYGWDFNSLRHNSFDKILTHEYFKESFCSSWKGKQSDAIPRLTACARTCGQEYEFSSIYGKNKIDINFKETINV